MSTKARAYHHGEVPAAAVKAATALVEAQGAASVTMRALANAIGVDHRALYRHFRDREAVLAAVAACGYRALLAVLQAGPPKEGQASALHADFAAYIDFALARPKLHALMLTASRETMDDHAELGRAVNGVLDHLMRSARPLAPGSAQQREAQAKDLALAGLAASYGLVSLAASGTLAPRTPADLRAFLIQQSAAALDGQMLRIGVAQVGARR